MKKNTKTWRSPSLGKDMQLTIYGTSGTPIIGIPARGASCRQWEEFGMVDAISYQLDNGFNQLYCLSSVDKESFLNTDATPLQRLVRHEQYESYLVEEIVPYIKDRNSIDYLIMAGTGLGGYHAVNVALKHPALFDKVISLSGIYDISQLMDDYYGDDLYFNNPVDFIPNLNKKNLLDQIRDIDFRLVSYQKDVRKEVAHRMSNIFRLKFIDHELDIWDIDADDEWTRWSQMLKTHII